LTNKKEQNLINMKFLKLLLPFFLLATFFTACENDLKVEEVKLDPTLLIGKWNLTGATVNKIPSPRLDGAYFEFTDGGILKTNIMGSEEEGSYKMSIEEKKLTQNTGKTIEYHIEKLVKDSLIMNMDIASKKFVVLLQKP
jgi:hypothetical protein